jgi:peptidoglycan hydrolase FlgJ
MAPNFSIGDVSAQFALDANALGNLKQQAKNDPKHALSAAAGQFEAMFMQMLLKSMREALPQDGPLASEASKTYTGMFDQQLAQQMAKKGLGIAEMLVKRLSGAPPPKEGGLAMPGSTMPAATRGHARDLVAPLAASSTVPAATRSHARDLVAPLAPSNTVAPTHQGVQSRPVPSAIAGSVAETVKGFVETLRPYAEAVAQKMGVPAHYLIAQAGLETGWGKSQPRTADGAPSRNLFGVKATGAWTGAKVEAATTEYTGNRLEKTTGTFRAYNSYTDAFQDFAALLQKSRRYANALANTHDAAKYATSLQQAGYATDPRYAEKLTRAIETVARYTLTTPPATQVVLAPADRRADLA